jgi:Glycosyltransferase family 87
MQRVASKSLVRIAASITLLLLLLLAGSELIKGLGPPDQVDFRVYLTAAELVREHKGAEIYSDADTGQNPQMRFATVGSTFQQTAARIGIPAVRLYVYPPTLADLLVPFTFLSVQHASDAWLTFNILTILGAAMLSSWMLYDTVFHLASIGFFFGILMFRANGWAFGEGQISSVLVVLWTAGIVCYVKGYTRNSAAVFALATAIKLTPLLVLLPFLVWREGRWVRWFAFSLAGICLALCLVNGPEALLDYALHVMPPMSAGFISASNVSLPSGLQQLYLGLTGENFIAEDAVIPSMVILGSKLIAGAVMLTTLIGIYRLGPLRSIMDRAKILALIALLSLYCSPVAWRSAYGIVFLAAFFLWKEAFGSGISKLELLLLVLCTLEFSFFFDTLFLRFTHGVLLSATALLAPASGCLLIFYTLRKMRLSEHDPHPAPTAHAPHPQLHESA